MTAANGGVALLVVAKAPVPGLAKTRIAATIGEQAAAELAAAALLDTLATIIDTGANHSWPVVVAMTGDLTQAARHEEIAEMLGGVAVVDQRGDGLAERLAHAHADAAQISGAAGTVQVGMDTPQLTSTDYITAAEAVLAGERVLGPADDGGWWLLGLPDASAATALIGVPMSTDQTAELTHQALGEVTWLRSVQDMDSWQDAQQIASKIPSSHKSRLKAVVAKTLAAGVPS